MSHPSTLRLHQFRLGELAIDDEDGVRTHLADCAACAARIDHQRAVRTEFARLPMPDALVPKPTLWERLGAWRAALVLVPIAAAAGVVVRLPPAQTVDDGVRSKGANALEAWVETGATARPLYTNESLAAGDRVQLKFDAHGHRFVTLAGRDGSGQAEIYSTLPAAAGLQTAPFALTLDATPGDQVFYAILTDTRPDPQALLTALADEPLRVDRAEVQAVVVHKE